MQIGLRQFSADTLEWLGQAVSAEGASRSGLAAELCEREGWHNAGGDPCVSSARKVLPRLAAKLWLSLPARKPEAPAGKQPGTLPLTAVLITEPDPPRKSRQPLRWLLLSCEGDATAEWAVRICGWYETRRSIEEYFRVLKAGTRIEDRRLDDADDLRKSLAFDAITAWRVFELERAGG